MMVPVPPGVLHHDVEHAVVHLNSDKRKLKAAPRYGMSGWADLGRSNQVVAAYRYFGQEPYFAVVCQPTIGPDPTARLGRVQRATKLLGVSVKDVQNETIGKVENLMVDLPAGRVVAVILSSGEFLGMTGELSAVPPAAFQFNSEQKCLQLDVSKETLRNAPHFKADHWPDFGHPDYADRIYRAYRVEPYFAANVSAEADSTGHNVRDRR
jgi:sporulation protein YlmC with PRC-barrel domain